MDAAELFARCLAVASGIVRQVRDDQFGDDTPCTEWNVRDLAGHMLYEVSWVPDLVSGKTMGDVGGKYEGDLVGDNAAELVENWQVAADLAESAAEECDPDETTHLSYGDVTNSEYLCQVAGDLLVHAWDLGKALGMTVELDPGLAKEIYDEVLPQEAEYRASGLFGEKVMVPETADVQTRLLGLFGRKADWMPENRVSF